MYLFDFVFYEFVLLLYHLRTSINWDSALFFWQAKRIYEWNVQSALGWEIFLLLSSSTHIHIQNLNELQLFGTSIVGSVWCAASSNRMRHGALQLRTQVARLCAFLYALNRTRPHTHTHKNNIKTNTHISPMDRADFKEKSAQVRSLYAFLGTKRAKEVLAS